MRIKSLLHGLISVTKQVVPQACSIISEGETSLTVFNSSIEPTSIKSLSSNNEDSLTCYSSTSKDSLPETPRRKLLKKQLKLKTTQLYRSKKKISDLKTKQTAKTRSQKIVQLLSVASEYLSKAQVDFFETQLRLSNRSNKGRRWSDHDKQLALSIFYQSPKTYKLLRKLFTLPTPRVLRKWMAEIQIKPGLNEIVFNALALKVKKMKEIDKNCIILLDEISLAVGLSYNQSSDTVEVLVDYGNDDRENVVANEALVFMIHGIFQPSKQILSFTFAKGATSSKKLKTFTIQCIEKLGEIGLNVRAVVADQGPNNRGLFNQLKVSKDKPYFFYNHQKVYCMFDPPHLLKSLRNNFRKYLMTVEGKPVRFHHVDNFYKYDKSRPLRLAPKLKKRHIHPISFSKMRVKDAAQIFCHSVAAAMSTCISFGNLDASAVYTADFISKVDSLFDAVNCSKYKSAKVLLRKMTSNSPHLTVLDESVYAGINSL